MSCTDFWKLLVRSRRHDLTDEDTLFNRCLTILDVILLGMGSMLGPGLYVATGQIARDTAGPAIVISLVIAAIPAILSSLCYAEFSARVSKTGSSYVYTYIGLGEIWAFIVGWNLILENVLASALIGNEFSKFINSISGDRIYKFMTEHMADWNIKGFRSFPDFIAFSIILMFTALSATGPRKPALFMRLSTMINLLVILFVVLSGFYFMDTSNWETLEKFAPYGFDGIMTGASLSYFAFLGFDIINSASEETNNPKRVVPFGNAVSTYVGVFIYLITAAILTLIIPYKKLSFSSPLPDAFTYQGFHIGKYLVAIGGFFGMSTALLTFIYAGTRLIYAMANDGLIFQFLAKINNRMSIPMRAALLCGMSASVIALFLNLNDLVEMLSIGTLFAYTAVPLAVLLERYRPLEESEFDSQANDDEISETESVDCYGKLRDTIHSTSSQYHGRLDFRAKFGDKPSEETHRIAGVAAASLLFAFFGFSLTVSPSAGLSVILDENPIVLFACCLMSLIFILALVTLFLLPTKSIRIVHAVPFMPFVPLSSILINIYLLTNLSRWTWARFAAWMFLGMAIYFMYGVHNSKAGRSEDSRSRDFLQRLREPARDIRVRAGSLSSDEGPLAQSSESENDEGFQSTQMTSEDESPKHAATGKEKS